MSSTQLDQHRNWTGSGADSSPGSFNYRGTTKLGRAISGYIDAPDEATAAELLERASIALEPGGLAPCVMRSARERKKVKREEIGLLATQLADRLKAGESFPSAVLAQAKGCRNRMLRNGLYEVEEALRNGSPAAQAFQLRPDVFPQYFCHMVYIGEQTGDPSKLLAEYGQGQIETAQTLGKLKGAMYYPATVLMLALGVIAVLVYFVIPKLNDIYESLLQGTGGELPALTRYLLASAHFLTSTAGAILIIFVAILASAAYQWARTAGRETVQRYSLKLPIAGGLIRDFNASYTIRMVGLLLEGGTDVNTALKQSAQSALHIVYRQMLEDMLEVTRSRGVYISDAAAPYAFLIGDEFRGICTAGEASGTITSQFRRYSSMLDEKVRRQIEALSRTVEPLMMVVLGGFVGLVVMAAYLPLFELIGHLAGANR
ncbi:MAG TPA: type II secretion system F family protein [Blastocatellia bacterium]|nr:type II secretion system F family protein [Blastocatellia bacterium]